MSFARSGRRAIFVVLLAIGSACGGDSELSTQTIRSPAPETEGEFGQRLAVDSDTLVVGSPFRPGGSLARIDTYDLTEQGWEHASLMDLESSAPIDHLALSGDSMMVALNGHVLPYERRGETWVRVQELVPPSQCARSLSTFGGSIVLQDDIAALHCSAYAGTPQNSAATDDFVVTYQRLEDNTWVSTDVLPAVEGTRYSFGQSLALDQGRLLVGAGGSKDGGNGRVYVFERDAAGWTLQARLASSDDITYLGFGRDVALSGDLAVVSEANGGLPGAGQVYAFQRQESGAWGLRTNGQIPGPPTSSIEPYELAMNRNRLVVSTESSTLIFANPSLTLLADLKGSASTLALNDKMLLVGAPDAFCRDDRETPAVVLYAAGAVYSLPLANLPSSLPVAPQFFNRPDLSEAELAELVETLNSCQP